MGGVHPCPQPPPPSRGLVDIFGDISRRPTAARAGSSAKGEGITPPPPPPGGGTRTHPPRRGGQERGASADPHPHPSGGSAQGADAATSTAQVELDLPSPPGAVAGQPGQLLPTSSPQKRAQRVGGKRTGQPRRPMQTMCDEHKAPACKSCKGHRGVRHCCSRHHEGHPRVLGGGAVQRCLPVQGGGGGHNSNWALCPLEGRCVRRRPRPGEGEGVPLCFRTCCTMG